MFKVLKTDKNTKARLGMLKTKHGVVETPCYVVVGTHAKVRELDSKELIDAKTRIVMVNTYHMWRKLGDEGLENFEGLHKFMNWDYPIMTDSGGFQVFSMGVAREHGTGKVKKEMENSPPSASWRSGRRMENNVRVTHDGVYFLDNGAEIYLDAKKSIGIQEQLGADIIFAFDEPTSPHHDYEYTKKALERTHRWAVESLESKKSDQLLYGIIQGGVFEDLRKQSAGFISSLDFDGIGIGGAFGASFGSLKEDTFKELKWIIPLLPENKPRHLLGIGLVDDIFEGVAAGIDTFDCVAPTREARHGSLWTSNGRIDVKKSAFKNDSNVIDQECGCFTCAEKKISKSDLRALFKEKNPEAGRLATMHNVYFFNDLMEKIRESIKDGKFSDLREKYKDFHNPSFFQNK